ncbi:hypothetical protein JNM87_05415 [Candidatus Saccharibacteria bacterium]|nr:hypothetical protein [Candidatus Saccharibacteria bacterium]
MTTSGFEAPRTGVYTSSEVEVTGALAQQVGLTQDALPHQRSTGELGEQLTEFEELDQLLQVGGEKFGFSAELHPVGENGEYGYVAVINKAEIDTELPLHLSDLDDTLIATTTAKTHLEEAFRAQLEADGIDLQALQEPAYSEIGGKAGDGIISLEAKEATNDLVSQIMKAADAFARWEEDGHVIHHMDAHYMALSWARRTLKDLAGMPTADVARHIVGVLGRITGQDGDMHVQAGPRFQRTESKLMNAEPELVNEPMAEAFMRLIGPEIFGDSLSTYRQEQLSGEANTGILSYGVPKQQLLKFLRLLAVDDTEYPAAAWQPNYVLLTKVDKGIFLKEVLKDPKSGLANDLKARRIITFFEDDPRQIESIATAGLDIKLSSIRSRRDGTKTAGHDTGPHGIEVDMRELNYGDVQPRTLEIVLAEIVLATKAPNV